MRRQVQKNLCFNYDFTQFSYGFYAQVPVTNAKLMVSNSRFQLRGSGQPVTNPLYCHNKAWA